MSKGLVKRIGGLTAERVAKWFERRMNKSVGLAGVGESCPLANAIVGVCNAGKKNVEVDSDAIYVGNWYDYGDKEERPEVKTKHWMNKFVKGVDENDCCTEITGRDALKILSKATKKKFI